MTREFQPDPEVIADLALRKQTERERRPVGDAIYAWRQPDFVGVWRCRECGVPCPIQQSDMENLAMWNRVLKARGEQPLDSTKIMLCDDCAKAKRARETAASAEHSTRITELVRQLKAAASPDDSLVIKALRDLGHPDVDGLLHELRERAGARAEREATRKPKPKAATL